jgi:hypothetical protein
MIIRSIGELAGKPRTPLNELFSQDSSGWIDIVKHGHYPTLSEMVTMVESLTGQDLTFDCFAFQFPQSLDNFGLIDTLQVLYGIKYPEYARQWSDTEGEITEQQIKIQKLYQNSCPAKSNNSLYFMVSDITETERVVYIGIAANGLLMRFFNGPGIHAQANNYIGDCRSIESPLKPNYTWRVKSAELRRRGVCRVYWTVQCAKGLKLYEKRLIEYKLELIRKSCSTTFGRDPVNR